MRGWGNDNCLNMPQLALTYPVHFHSSPLTHFHISLLRGWSEISMSIHSSHQCPSVHPNLKSELPRAHSILQQLWLSYSPATTHKSRGNPKAAALSPGWAQIHLPRVYPSAAVECVTHCPGAITVPLHTRFPQFITTIGACQLLLMISQPLPMKETIDWQRRWGGWGLPRHYLCFFLYFKSSSAACCKLGQSVLYNLHSCCYFKSRFAAEIQVSNASNTRLFAS